MFASQKKVLKAAAGWKGPYTFELNPSGASLSLYLDCHVGVASLLPKTQFPKLQDAHSKLFPAAHGGWWVAYVWSLQSLS